MRNNNHLWVILVLLITACTQSPTTSDINDKNIPLSFPENTVTATSASTVFQAPEPWEGAVLYDFNDLNGNCILNDNTIPNPYRDLVFEKDPVWTSCEGVFITDEGISGKYAIPAEQPSTLFENTRIRLPEPAEKVRIITSNYRSNSIDGVTTFYSALVAFDADGNEIDREFSDVLNNVNGIQTSRLLTVGEDSNVKIFSIGLEHYQVSNLFDNLEILYRQGDTTPPVISYQVEKTNLAPANHKLHLAVSGIRATDDSGEPVALNVSVESSEAVNGSGDGNTDFDWKVVSNADGTYDVYLRAERSGHNSVRFYTVTITAEDSSGNVAKDSLIVSVTDDALITSKKDNTRRYKQVKSGNY